MRIVHLGICSRFDADETIYALEKISQHSVISFTHSVDTLSVFETTYLPLGLKPPRVYGVLYGFRHAITV